LIKLSCEIVAHVFVFIEGRRQQSRWNIAIDGDRLGPAAVI
jgi:hypothetical protein